MCDLGGGGGVWEMSHHTPLLPRKENKKEVAISTEFTIVCFFVFKMPTEVEEEMIRRIAIISRRASFPFLLFVGV